MITFTQPRTLLTRENYDPGICSQIFVTNAAVGGTLLTGLWKLDVAISNYQDIFLHCGVAF
jgi:hypothetical protein